MGFPGMRIQPHSRSSTPQLSSRSGKGLARASAAGASGSLIASCAANRSADLLGYGQPRGCAEDTPGCG